MSAAAASPTSSSTTAQGGGMLSEPRFAVIALGMHLLRACMMRLVELGWLWPNVGFSLASLTTYSNNFPFVATLLGFVLFCRLIRMPEGEMRRQGCSEEGKLVELPTCITHYTMLEPFGESDRSSEEIVVILHGYSGDVSHTMALGREVRRAGYRVLLYDLVGRGFSSCRNYDHTASLFVSQLCELVTSLELKEKRLHLVGVSLGGGVVASYAKFFPTQVASLTLIAAVGLPLCSSVHIFTRMPLLPDFLFRCLPESTVLTGLEHEWTDCSNPKFEAMNDSYKLRMQTEPALARSLLSTARHFPFEGLRETFTHLGDSKKRPTLLIWGDDDRTCPVRNAWTLHEHLIPNSTLRIVRGARHCVYSEYVGDVARELLAFLHRTQHSDSTDPVVDPQTPTTPATTARRRRASI